MQCLHYRVCKMIEPLLRQVSCNGIPRPELLISQESRKITGAETFIKRVSKYLRASMLKCLSSSLHLSKSRWKKWQTTFSVCVTASRKSPALHITLSGMLTHSKIAGTEHVLLLTLFNLLILPMPFTL